MVNISFTQTKENALLNFVSFLTTRCNYGLYAYNKQVYHAYNKQVYHAYNKQVYLASYNSCAASDQINKIIMR